jgi:hypothetical protein
MEFFKGFSDERFVLHRYKSTRFATMVTALTMVAIFNYDYLARGLLNQSMILLLSIMAGAKVAAMVYYRFTN